MKRTKRAAAFAAAIAMCVSAMPAFSVSAADVIASETYSGKTISSDGFIMTRIPNAEDEHIKYPFNYTATLTKDNVFTISCSIPSEYKVTLPYDANGTGENGYPAEILFGTLATNSSGNVEVWTPTEGTIDVADNWMKSMWTNLDDEGRVKYGGFSWWDKTYPIAIMQDSGENSDSIFDAATHTIKSNTPLFEVKLYDYELGTIVFLGDNSFVADYTDDTKTKISIDKYLSQEKAEKFYPYVEADGEKTMSYITDAEMNIYKDADWKTHIAALEKQFNAGEISDEEYIELSKSYHFSTVEVPTAEGLYNIITYTSDIKPSYDDFRAVTVDKYGIENDGSYIVGTDQFISDNVRFTLDYTASSAFTIKVEAAKDITFADGTTIDFGTLKFSTTKGELTEELGGVSIGVGDGMDVEFNRGDEIYSMTFDPAERYAETLGERYNHFNAADFNDKCADVYFAGKVFHVNWIHPTLGISNITMQDSAETSYPEALKTAKLLQNYIIGDANDDGNLDIIDVISINKFILGVSTLNNQRAADIDDNGSVDSSDSLNALKLVLGMLDDFDLEELRS